MTSTGLLSILVVCRCRRPGARPGPASPNPTGFGSSGGPGGVTDRGCWSSTRAWSSLPVHPETVSTSLGERNLLPRLCSGQNRDRHSTRPCFAETFRRSTPCGHSMHSITLQSVVAHCAGSADVPGISRIKWDGQKHMTPNTWLWLSYWIAASSRSTRACTGAEPGWVSSFPRPSYNAREAVLR
jgi:hypothetical protein